MMESESLIRQLNLAIANRDRKAAYRITAQIQRIVCPDDPADLARIRATTHHYAAEMCGWEMEDA